MISDLLARAIDERVTLSFVYDDMARIVEPHAVGFNPKDELILRGYQVDGDSATNPRAWKLFKVDKISDLMAASSQPFAGPREGYKAGDKAMARILAELPEPEAEAA